MHELTPARLAQAEAWAANDGLGGTLPADPIARFARRIDSIMHATGQGRTWARRRAIEQWPDEAAAAGWPPA